MTSVPAKTSDFDYDTGLEQFGVEDAVIPRLSIVHKDGQFKDSLTNAQFTTIKVIILGLVKQRVLFHPVVDDGDWPMCKSADHDTGFPNMSDEQPKEKRFALLWDKAGFDPKDFPPDENGVIRLPCDSCQLKEWGTHPDGKKPYCAEQFTLPILYDPDEDGSWVPAIITFQKTALKPLKAYLSSFARSKNAAFMAITEIGLDMQKRGANEYSVPNFKKVGNTDEENWREYSSNYRSMADFLRADPGLRVEEEETSPPTTSSVSEEKVDDKSDVVDGEVVEDQKSAVAAPVPDDNDDLPF